MAKDTFNSIFPACGQWETLLADALDGQLKSGDEAAFTAHMAVCPACAALFDDARVGREWLEFLSAEPEVPAGLLDKILSKTGPGQVESYGLAASGGNVIPIRPTSAPAFIPAWQRPGFVGNVRRFAEPRLLMTAAMAFFSISVTVSLTNVRLSSVRLSDLRPAAVRSMMERQLNTASTPIIRYCDHSRFVYEVEATVRQLRRATQDEGEGRGDDNRQKPNETTPGESRQNPNHDKGISPAESPQQSGNPAPSDSNNFLETSQAVQAKPALSGGSATAPRERSTLWTA
jgi:hypothetical protein